MTYDCIGAILIIYGLFTILKWSSQEQRGFSRNNGRREEWNRMEYCLKIVDRTARLYCDVLKLYCDELYVLLECWADTWVLSDTTTYKQTLQICEHYSGWNITRIWQRIVAASGSVGWEIQWKCCFDK